MSVMQKADSWLICAVSQLLEKRAKVRRMVLPIRTETWQ